MAGLGFSSGGFFPATLGWAAVLALAFTAVAGTIAGWPAPTKESMVFLGAVAGLVAWTALSLLWSVSRTSTAHEVERSAAYLGFAAGAFVLARSRTALRHGVLAGTFSICVYAVATRLLPDMAGQFDSTSFGYRLATPVTYWNGLGALAAMGIVLAFAHAASPTASRIGATAAGGAIPLLAETVYFTFSRGAWLALALGLLAFLVLTRHRVSTLVAGVSLAPWTALAVHTAHRGGLVARRHLQRRRWQERARPPLRLSGR